MNNQTENKTPADAGPTIAERTARGRETNSVADGAIVPAMAPLDDVPLPEALSGNQRKDLEARLRAGDTIRRHIYRAPCGANIAAVVRLEDKQGGKSFRPLRQLGCDKDGRAIYNLSVREAPRPLYNLDRVATRGDAPILFVEGEKTADAAAERFPHVIATTWQSGAQGVGKVDVRDAAGAEAILWADNDEPGRKAMEKLAVRLLAVGCTVRIVEVPASYPEKWDLADPDPEGAAGDTSPEALLASARVIDPATAAAMLRGSQPRAKRSSGNAAGQASRADVVRAFSALRFLGSVGKRDYGAYIDWFQVLAAAKNTLGESGFSEAVALSHEYGGTDSEEEIRRKWDSIKERPEGEQLTMATFFAEAIGAGWEDPGGSSSGGGEGGGSRADPAAFVLEQSAEAGDVLWLDQYGKPHVSLVVEQPDGSKRTVHARLGSRRHKGVISRRYTHAKPNKVLAAEQEKRALLLMEHEAREGGNVFQSDIRAAAADDCIYVDLGRTDGKAVRIDHAGWSIVADPPVRFVRGNRGELPLPQPGGALEDLCRHLNLPPADVVRATAFVIGALSPLGSFPILLVEGQQGTAKSTIGDMVLMLCDPARAWKAGRLTMPRGDQNLMVHAGGVRVVYVDNLSDITPSEADSLCRLSTGGGTSARQHYSDEDEVQLNAVRPTIVTCIGTPSGRGDFLDRCLRVTAKPIEQRQTEEAVYAAFVADWPRMLGFVCDALSASLRNKAAVQARVDSGELRLGRMADFALRVEGAAELLGLAPGEFSQAILDEQAHAQAEAALGDSLGEGIARWFSGDDSRTELAGYATEILDAIRVFFSDPSVLPPSNKLKGALRRIEPGLRDLGLEVEIKEPTGRANKTLYRITRTPPFQPIGEKLPF